MNSNFEFGTIDKLTTGTPSANAATTIPTTENGVEREGVGINLEKDETCDQNLDEEGKCVNKRKLRSEIWKHFNRYKNDKRVWKADCHYCKKTLSGDMCNETSHLK